CARGGNYYSGSYYQRHPGLDSW
nr:immunoglobulin heavy chain junction region [Macaca mulatta]MOW46652.1 immunoglobulin heavy chain junction region [Macaca mulatta]MOW46822.1 immunoglobulin heavy chain junction region [Macaca mulatta]MOW47058.1 immunoglobulin heavy chain junction region [Macaca mulatta]MOW47351.1 immunoglobulin heavy chain junction region [Macaca mulatta]